MQVECQQRHTLDIDIDTQNTWKLFKSYIEKKNNK